MSTNPDTKTLNRRPESHSAQSLTPEEELATYGYGWLTATEEYRQAMRLKADRWVPANGGHETPSRTRSGVMVLYCFNPATGEHAYLDTGSDIILSDDELRAMGLA